MSSIRILAVFLAGIMPLAAYAQSPDKDFLAAARKGDAETIKALLAKGVDVNTKTEYGATALSYASDRGHVEIIKILIEHGADVNVKDTFYNATPMTWAASKGHAEVVKLLLDKGAQGVDMALIVGVRNDNIELVKVALEKGGINSQTLSMALKRATDSGKSEITELLKKAGAQPPPAPNFKVDEETLKSYAGIYKSDNGAELKFEVKEGKLTGGPSGQAMTLGATDKTNFALLEVEGITITFNVVDGKVVSLTVNQSGNSAVYKKLEEK